MKAGQSDEDVSALYQQAIQLHNDNLAPIATKLENLVTETVQDKNRQESNNDKISNLGKVKVRKRPFLLKIPCQFLAIFSVQNSTSPGGKCIFKVVCKSQKLSLLTIKSNESFDIFEMGSFRKFTNVTFFFHHVKRFSKAFKSNLDKLTNRLKNWLETCPKRFCNDLNNLKAKKSAWNYQKWVFEFSREAATRDQICHFATFCYGHAQSRIGARYARPL